MIKMKLVVFALLQVPLYGLQKPNELYDQTMHKLFVDAFYAEDFDRIAFISNYANKLDNLMNSLQELGYKPTTKILLAMGLPQPGLHYPDKIFPEDLGQMTPRKIDSYCDSVSQLIKQLPAAENTQRKQKAKL